MDARAREGRTERDFSGIIENGSREIVVKIAEVNVHAGRRAGGRISVADDCREVAGTFGPKSQFAVGGGGKKRRLAGVVEHGRVKLELRIGAEIHASGSSRCLASGAGH